MLVNLPCNEQTLKMLFPASANNQSRFGRIPMSFFDANETEIRAFMQSEKLKAIYRGPRVSNRCVMSTPSLTRRCDAVAVMLYRK